MDSKNLIEPSKADKGRRIYELWKKKDPRFRQYLDGEAYTMILIAKLLLDNVKKLIDSEKG